LLALKLLPSQVLPLLPLPLEQAGMLLELVEMNGLQVEQLKNGVKLPLSQLSNGKVSHFVLTSGCFARG
jgi:hypothetical protein